MKLKPYYLGLVLLLLLGLTASSAFGVGGAGTVTGGTFPACVDPANTSTSSVKIAGKQVAPGGLVRVPTGTSCLSSETTLNLNSYVKTVLVSPGATNVASGTNLQNALSAATAGTLIKIEPGTYDLVTTTLTMKQGIDLEGSGEGLTIITSQIGGGNFPPPSATVLITNSSEIRFLSITNSTTGNYSAAVNGSGLDNTAKLTNVTVNANGIALVNISINLLSSSPTIQNSTIFVSNASGENRGIYSNNSSPTIINTRITASGNNSYGILNSIGSPVIQNSTITAAFSLLNFSGIVKVGASELVGLASGGTLVCAASYNGNFVALSPTCT